MFRFGVSRLGGRVRGLGFRGFGFEVFGVSRLGVGLGDYGSVVLGSRFSGFRVGASGFSGFCGFGFLRFLVSGSWYQFRGSAFRGRGFRSAFRGRGFRLGFGVGGLLLRVWGSGFRVRG